jgi:hypothetical protein
MYHNGLLRKKLSITETTPEFVELYCSQYIYDETYITHNGYIHLILVVYNQENIMVNRKPGRKSIIEKLDALNKILSMIPSDGSCVQFKKLNEGRKQEHIGLGTMNKVLKELEEKGLVSKEPIKLSHGAGTCYRRTIPIPKLDELGWSAFIRENKRTIEITKDPDERERVETLYLTRALENYMSIIFKTLAAAGKMNPKAAEGFIDAAGKTYLTGLLLDINSLKTGDETLEITRVAFGHPQFQLDEARKAVHERGNIEERTDEEHEKHIKETFGIK